MLFIAGILFMAIATFVTLTVINNSLILVVGIQGLCTVMRRDRIDMRVGGVYMLAK